MALPRIAPSILLFLLATGAASSAPAVPAPENAKATSANETIGMVTETTIGPEGTVLLRTLTPGGDLPSNMDPLQPLEPLGALRGVNTYLWVDRNHQNAIAERVAISGNGQYGFAGWWLNSKRVSLYSILGDEIPEWSRPMIADFQIDVDANLSGDRLTATARGDSLYVLTSASSDPLYSHQYTPPLVGYRTSVSNSGNSYMSGGGNPDGTSGEVYVYDGTGILRFKTQITAPPEGVFMSADGLVAAANVRGYVKVWDAMTGALRDSIPISGETQTPAVLSGDGGRLVTGGFSHVVRVYEWNGSEYVQLWGYNMPGVTWTTAVAISEDGSTVAAGGWSVAGLYSGRVVIFDISSSTPLWTDSSFGDWVASVSLSANGQTLAAGSWGRYDGTVGTVVSVYSRSSAIPTDTITDDGVTGVGSCMCVDISRDGHYLMAGGKAVHAREFGSGGWAMAMELADPAGISDGTALPRFVASPNPFTGSVRIDLAAGTTAPSGPVSIFAADGRLVRTFSRESADRGWIWDGTDASGSAVSAGAYFLRSEAGSLRLVRVR